MRAVYVFNLHLFINSTDLASAGLQSQLAALADAGMNTIVLQSPFTVAEAQVVITAASASSTFSRYKYVLGLNGATYNIKQACVAARNCDVVALDAATMANLDAHVAFAKQNPGFVVGYYTFDEPLDDVHKNLQEKVYSYIRQQDPESLKRPIILGNTMWFVDPPQGSGLSDSRLDSNISRAAQDVIFVDQYASDYGTQLKYYQWWVQKNLLVSFVPVLPAFDNSTPSVCAGLSFDLIGPMSNGTLPAIGASGALTNLAGGRSYFAFWPSGQGYWNQGGSDISTCAPIRDATMRSLRSGP